MLLARPVGDVRQIGPAQVDVAGGRVEVERVRAALAQAALHRVLDARYANLPPPHPAARMAIRTVAAPSPVVFMKRPYGPRMARVNRTVACPAVGGVQRFS
jgi:hypothetical protein